LARCARGPHPALPEDGEGEARRPPAPPPPRIASISAHPLPPLLQEAAHRGVGFEADRLLVGGVSRCDVASSGEERYARCPIGLVLREPRIAFDDRQRSESRSRAVGLGDRDGAVDGDQRRSRLNLDSDRRHQTAGHRKFAATVDGGHAIRPRARQCDRCRWKQGIRAHRNTRVRSSEIAIPARSPI
jgi:hypothetical protein